MKLEKNSFKSALKAGRTQIGLWISFSSPFSADVVALAGFDWAMIDMEHSPGDHLSVMGQLQSFADAVAKLTPHNQRELV